MAGEAGRDPRAWLAVDETAAAFLARSLSSRPPITLPPPLHRAPLRPGNVVEIAGPSNSGKSHLLLMAAVQCILPKEWEGIYFGGLGRVVMYLDLDCRFDVLRLAQILRNRIAEGCRLARLRNGDPENDVTKYEFQCSLQKALFSDCMQHFLYARCCNSPEFIDALKTVQSQSRREVSNAGIYFVMIDSIGAFYWIDRGSQTSRENKGKTLQSIFESVVHELRKLLQLEPALILVTKAPIYGEGTTTANDFNRSNNITFWKHLFSKLGIIKHQDYIFYWDLPLSVRASGFGTVWATFLEYDGRVSSKYMLEDPTGLGYSRQAEERTLSNRDYMPSIWQSFVTHRINLQVKEAEVPSVLESEVLPLHTSEWVQPCLKTKEKFSIMDDGVNLIQ